VCILAFLRFTTRTDLLDTGGGIMGAGSVSSMQLGAHIIVGGLCVQILFFGCFIVVSVSFDYAIHKAPTEGSRSSDIPWHKHLKVLYLASVLIMVRSIFRVVEYAQGNDGFLLRHEFFLYLFDATLMFAVMVVFNIIHPSEIGALLKGKVVRGFKLSSPDGNLEAGTLSPEKK
jgi:RTA1 like protein